MLRSVPVLEADRLVTILTPDLGKFKAAVRGARRLKSRLGGHLDALNRVSLTLAQGRTFDVVTGAEALETFGVIKADLDRLAMAIYLMELADALLPEHSPHPAAFRLVLESLLAVQSLGPHPAIPRFLELRLLADTGYMPELGQCVACGSVIIAEHHRYAPNEGGVVCDQCAVTQGQVLPLSVDALKVLRFLAGHGLADAVRLELKPALSHELEAILAGSLHHVVERNMAAGEFIDHLRVLRSRRAKA